MKWINKILGSKSAETRERPPSKSESTTPLTAKQYYTEGWKFHEKDKFEEAAREYRQALQLDPDFALARSNLGMVYKQQGKMEDAIRVWQETLDRGTANTVVRMNTEDWLKDARARFVEQAKPVSEIESSLDSYMKELGQASSTWHIASASIARLGAPAIDSLIKAVESDNDLLRSRAMDLLGRIGDKSAIPVLEKAAKMNESDFRQMTGITGKGRLVTMGGTQIEVPISGLIDDYHAYAREAIKQIKKRG